MTISAVVLQHNLPALTTVAVASIRESDTPVDELIIVDNGSTPDTWLATVKMMNLQTRLIRLDTNRGYVIGTNRGWQAAVNDYILISTNDVALSKSCIGRLARVLDNDKQVGWVCAHYQHERAGIPDYSTRFPDDALSECNDSHGANRERLNAWAAQLADIEPPYPAHAMTEATVFMVRKKTSDAIGEYWEDLTYYHTHDYGKRLASAGWIMTSHPHAVFWHDPSHPTIRLVTGSIVSEGIERSQKLYNERYNI